jgi:hypothetical protein
MGVEQEPHTPSKALRMSSGQGAPKSSGTLSSPAQNPNGRKASVGRRHWLSATARTPCGECAQPGQDISGEVSRSPRKDQEKTAMTAAPGREENAERRQDSRTRRHAKPQEKRPVCCSLPALRHCGTPTRRYCQRAKALWAPLQVSKAGGRRRRRAKPVAKPYEKSWKSGWWWGCKWASRCPLSTAARWPSEKWPAATLWPHHAASVVTLSAAPGFAGAVVGGTTPVHNQRASPGVDSASPSR